jgi:Xaa-Pro aminopeptidase
MIDPKVDAEAAPRVDPLPLRSARLARLRAAMAECGEDALVLTSAAAVRYATGASPPHGDSSAETARPFAAVVTAAALQILGLDPASAPPGVEVEPLPRAPERAAGAIAALLADARRVGVERLPFAVGDALQGAVRAELVPAEPTVLAARARKAPEEIDLLREAQRSNEHAVAEVLPAIVPGVREVELTGRFLAAMARRGVTACHVEPIWCVVPRRAAEAPWTFPGGLPYRELPSARPLVWLDQVMIDTGMLHHGYMSDFGCTWSCGGQPDARDRRLRTRWQEVIDAVLAECRPGATAAALVRAARAAHGEDRPAPWPVPLYLAHGIGIGGVEPPFIGTDLGPAVEEAIILAPGMALVLEPYVWEEGSGGYRAEQMIAITETGFERLSAPPP